MRMEWGKVISYTLAIIVILLSILVNNIETHPISSPEAVVEDMRQIPQWHCLRYRKFDLVKRCRNYRLMRRQ